MIEDKGPEIREDFSITVKRANKTEELYVSEDGIEPARLLETKIEALAKEVLNERRRLN